MFEKWWKNTRSRINYSALVWCSSVLRAYEFHWANANLSSIRSYIKSSDFVKLELSACNEIIKQTMDIMQPSSVYMYCGKSLHIGLEYFSTDLNDQECVKWIIDYRTILQILRKVSKIFCLKSRICRRILETNKKFDCREFHSLRSHRDRPFSSLFYSVNYYI